MNRQFSRFALASSVAFASLWTTQPEAASDPIGMCATHLISSPTSYPDMPARARRGGKLSLAVTVAPDGTVAEAFVRKSSGTHALDTAALHAALTKWRFAPSSCGGSVATEVAIEFEPRMMPTLSMSRAAGYRKKLLTAAERGCEVSQDGDDSVITCITGTPARTRLAVR